MRRIGTLVLCEALRPASVLAKALATLDRVSGGRVDIGLGAGWYEPEYDAIGMAMPPPGRRITRLGEYAAIVQAMLDGTSGPVDHRRVRIPPCAARRNDPPAALQQPARAVFLGGKGDRLLATVARARDPGGTRAGRGPSTRTANGSWHSSARCSAGRSIRRRSAQSLGLYALCGEDERDVRRRFERLVASSPPGVLDGVTLDDFRRGRLVGTVDEITDQLAAWAELGVETIIAGVGAVPFQLAALDDVGALRAGQREELKWTIVA